MEKGKRVKVGNYHLELSSYDDGVDKLVLSAIGGRWNVCWDADLNAAQFIISLVDEMESGENSDGIDPKGILSIILTNIFTVDNCLHGGLVRSVFDDITEFVDGIKHSEDADDEFTDGGRKIAEMAEKYNEIEKEVNGGEGEN